MNKAFLPRLSEARDFLPFLRAALAAASGRHTLPDGFSLDLVPIVEQGVFGYEMLPDLESCDYLTIGRDEEARPLLRRSVYHHESAAVLRLATFKGRVIAQHNLDRSNRVQCCDVTFADWDIAAEAAWNEFDALFPNVPRRVDQDKRRRVP